MVPIAVRLSAMRNGGLLIYFGKSPGDDLLCTAVLREVQRRRHRQVCMISNYPELFCGARDASYVAPVGKPYRRVAQKWKLDYRELDYARYDGDDQSEVPARHIVAELCSQAGVKGAISIRPYLILNDVEKSRAAWSSGQILIQSSGMGARHPMLNKQWYPDRFQMVVDQLKADFDFIQLGSIGDPPLKHVKDLRGQTTIRDAAALLDSARLYIGTVGFLMHLARAVDCPSVIIYGGREAPWQSGYICNVNLYSAVPCAPCWQWNRCDFDRRCMKEITVNEVVAAVRELARRPRSPLPVETVDIE
jgi:hypothetical protein